MLSKRQSEKNGHKQEEKTRKKRKKKKTNRWGKSMLKFSTGFRTDEFSGVCKDGAEMMSKRQSEKKKAQWT